MLLPLLLLVAAAGATEADRGRYAACLAFTKSDPARAIETAQAWRVENGGTGAMHCLALAHYARKDFAAAFAAFDGAVRASQMAGDGQAVVLLNQAADAALAAGQPDKALGFLDRALVNYGDGPALSPGAEAALRVIRAEALVDLNRNTDAAADLARATTLDPNVPDGWLLRATLARRMGDLGAAETAILKAAAQTPDSAAVQFEAGVIAATQGNMDLAKTAWIAASSADPESVAGQAAAKALKDATVVPPAPRIESGVTGADGPRPQL
jgi:tetratricopeptide (TPR) repeat protein